MKFNFQFVMVAVFIVAAIFGMLVFSGTIPIGGGTEEGALGEVMLWGTVPATLLRAPLEEFNGANPSFILKYEERSAATFDRDLLEALAAGRGPDMFLISNDLAFHYSDKIVAIPYANYSPAAFKNIFAGAGEVFLTPQGVLAFPLSVDPLMLYYNRSMLDAQGIVFPPKDWEEFTAQAAKLTEKDAANQIKRSGAALGQYANVAHAKDILSMLFMQAGNPIIISNSNTGRFESALEAAGTYNISSILEFYTSFTDPSSTLYTWNRSFPNSADVFSSEDLAFYFGYASELQMLVNKNPNQNFQAGAVPQIKGGKTKLTSAKVTGVAVSSASKNLNTALTAANLLASSDFAGKYAAALGIPPARRDLLAAPPPDTLSPVFYSSALIARGWLDPAPEDTNEIFGGMVGSVLSNNLSAADALQDASSKLDLLLIK